MGQEPSDRGGRSRRGRVPQCRPELHQDSGGRFVARAVIDNVSPAMAVAREEASARSSRCLRSTPTRKHSPLAVADDTDCGPAATVWSHGIDRALTPARGVRAGTVAVNGPDAEHASSLPRPDRDSDVEGS
ncbi:aldehyde dehydrogenase family protein [Streptomyces phaeochromogenes]|uniref:aldehyde dehydrogenase family protein n=1 Tax=Streptomyces phaeochromogenes TaxID=1923 RepID=UPI000A5CC571